MKGFVLILLCALVAVQARYTLLQKNTRTAAALGERPWVVHLRIAVNNSGFLKTCAGTLIHESWVLTAGSCVKDVRFFWVRYGVVDVISPSLVTEGSIANINPDVNLAVLSINRVVQTTDFIKPAPPYLVEDMFPLDHQFCRFGANENGEPGENLFCNVVLVDPNTGVFVPLENTIDEVMATEYDLGTGAVWYGGEVVFVLTEAGDDTKAGTFTFVTNHLDWLETVTGVEFRSKSEVEKIHPEPLYVPVVN